MVNSKTFLMERGFTRELASAAPKTGHSEEYIKKFEALIASGAKPFWSYGKTTLVEKFKVKGIVHMWEPRSPEEGTELASQLGGHVFFFGLSASGASTSPREGSSSRR